MKFKLIILLAMVVVSGAYSCKQKDYIYEVNPVEVQAASANKDKLKTTEQYISVLYANLFQKALGVNELLEISNVIQSIGDKELAHEVIISNFMNREDVILPADSIMRADPGTFISETYERFLIREPTELEKEYFINYINAHPDLSAELVYFSFAISNEYQFY